MRPHALFQFSVQSPHLGLGGLQTLGLFEQLAVALGQSLLVAARAAQAAARVFTQLVGRQRRQAEDEQCKGQIAVHDCRLGFEAVDAAGRLAVSDQAEGDHDQADQEHEHAPPQEQASHQDDRGIDQDGDVLQAVGHRQQVSRQGGHVYQHEEAGRAHPAAPRQPEGQQHPGRPNAQRPDLRQMAGVEQEQRRRAGRRQQGAQDQAERSGQPAVVVILQPGWEEPVIQFHGWASSAAPSVK